MNNIFDILLPYQKSFFKNKKKRKIFLASRQIGKSFVAATILVFKALSKKYGTSLCVSVNQNSASEIIKKCIQVAEAVKLLTGGKITYSASFDKIVFSNGSRVISLSSNPQSLRGYTATCVVVDEAAFVEHLDQIMQAISPTLTRDKQAELILLTTPAGKNGYFYQLYERAMNAPGTWYVQTTTIYDAINDGLNVDIEALKSLCPDPAIFAQEYLCQFANSNISLIDTDLIKTFDTLPNMNDYFIGVDFGRVNDYTSISVVGRDRENKLYLIDLTTIKNTEFSKQLDVIKAKFTQYQPKLLFGDSGGLGLPLCEELSKFNSRCKPFFFTAKSKPEAFSYFKKVINANELFIKKEFLSDIATDVQNVTQIISDDGRVSYIARHSKDGHSDRLSSLLLALMANHDSPITFQLPVAIPRNSRF